MNTCLANLIIMAHTDQQMNSYLRDQKLVKTDQLRCNIRHQTALCFIVIVKCGSNVGFTRI